MTTDHSYRAALSTDRAIEDMAMYMWEEGSLLAVQKQMKEYTKI